MAGLAESSLEPVTKRQWAIRVLLVVVIAALLGGLALWLKSTLGSPVATKRQVSKIAILPDTPPPPPPPKEEKRPEPPKDEPKQVVREEQLKQDVPKPANEPIKMEGPAGDGPSAFAAGSISKDYQGGAPVVGAASSGAAGKAADRAQERFYANAVRQMLRDEIERHLRPEAGELTATLSFWIEPDGSIRRYELLPTGDSTKDADLQAALAQVSQRLRLPGHAGFSQPMRFKLTLRPA